MPWGNPVGYVQQPRKNTNNNGLFPNVGSWGASSWQPPNQGSTLGDNSLFHGPGWVNNLPVGVGNGGNRRRGPGLPIDAQGRLDLSALAQQRLNFMRQYNTQLSDINHNYGTQRQRMQENEPYVQRGIISSYAGSGMARGTGYATATGREGQLYQQQLNDLDYARQMGLRQLNDQRYIMRQNAQNQRQSIRQAAADRLAAQADTLGLAHPHWSQHRIDRTLGVGGRHGGHRA